MGKGGHPVVYRDDLRRQVTNVVDESMKKLTVALVALMVGALPLAASATAQQQGHHNHNVHKHGKQMPKHQHKAKKKVARLNA
jgi:hypothetical protein